MEHRLDASELAKILRLAAPLLKSTDLPVEIEYESGVLSQYSVAATGITPSGLLLHLGNKRTACLAEDLCDITPAQSGCC